jgi:hypothetical protein
MRQRVFHINTLLLRQVLQLLLLIIPVTPMSFFSAQGLAADAVGTAAEEGVGASSSSLFFLQMEVTTWSLEPQVPAEHPPPIFLPVVATPHS